MRLGFSVLVLFLSLLTWTTDASAYAWMVRHGYAKCTNCHTDPSGGETLNHMGRVTSQTLLSQQWGEDGELRDTTGFLFGVAEPDWMRLGGSVRGLALYDVDSGNALAFPMQADLYGSVELGGLVGGFSVGAPSGSATPR